MFILTIYDRLGNELKEGDIVKISDGHRIQFFAEIKWLEQEQALAPFHTFSFHSVEKVESVPFGCVKCTEDRYNIWYLPETVEDDYGQHQSYLTDWKECEYLLEKRMFRVQKMNQL